jgi:hypothetical protein
LHDVCEYALHPFIIQDIGRGKPDDTDVICRQPAITLLVMFTLAFKRMSGTIYFNGETCRGTIEI